MLWQVKGGGLSLLGSVHMLDEPTLPLSDAAWSAVGAAARLVFEHDITHQPDVSFARLPATESLGTLIPASLFTVVERRCRELSLDTASVVRFQPWFVGLWLASETAKRHGLTHENGVDKKLLAQAQAQGKVIEFFESASDALLTFSNAPVAEQIRLLSLAVGDSQDGIEFLKRMISGWKKRRADAILECVNERIAQMPTMFSAVIEGRNRAWLPRLLVLAEEGQSTLAIAGVLHMVGTAGLPALLRQAGYDVAAVDVSSE